METDHILRDLRLSRRWRFKLWSSGPHHYTASQPRRPRLGQIEFL